MNESIKTDIEPYSSISNDTKGQWKELDTAIRSWWDNDLRRATEQYLPRPHPNGHDNRAQTETDTELLYLPFPYVTPGGSEGTFPCMFGWDTHFIDLGLLAHDRPDLVLNHIRNHLSMIERLGYVPNGNTASLSTRSQVPLLPNSVWLYYKKTRDLDILYRAFPLLKHEYFDYWNASHHITPIGLSTNRDIGDNRLSPEFAAEAEALDWTPIFDGDITYCTPLITNCALVRYANILSFIAKELGRVEDEREFRKEAKKRVKLIRKYCWDEELGFFLEYNFDKKERLPYISACAYWTLWAGVATSQQAQRLVDNLYRLEQQHGIASTEKAYPDPHRVDVVRDKFLAQLPDTEFGAQRLSWMYPAGWPPEQLIIVDGLDSYGYFVNAQRIAARFLNLISAQYATTGKLWERYNVVEGSIELPNARYGNMVMHGWTSAAVAVLGRRIFS